MAKQWWVWARDENNAIEEMYHCREYGSEAQALRHSPVGDYGKALFEVRVERIPLERGEEITTNGKSGK